MAIGLAFGQPFSGAATLSNIPNIAKRGFRGWLKNYISALSALVPTTQATVLYFSNAGSDGSGDGSVDNPYATVAKANTLMGAGKEFRFRFGDIYKEANGLIVGAFTGVVCTGYAFGGRTERDGIPIISKFQADYSAGGWSLTGGQTKTYQRTDLNGGTLGWVREKNSYGQANVYRKVTSIAEVEANAGTWWVSGTTVYIHPHDDRNPVSDGRVYESVLKNGIDGCAVNVGADQVYVNKLRFDGWGLDPDSASAFYGIHVNTAGNSKTVVVKDCAAYYNGRHNIGLTSAGDGCQVLFLHCSAGWTTPLGDNPLVDYSANGGQVAVWVEPTVVAGNLPVGANTWYPYATGGCPAYVSHGGADTRFSCVYKPRIVDGPYGCGFVGSMQNAPNCSADINLARAFIIEANLRIRDLASYIETLKLPWTNSVGMNFTSQGDSYTVHVNCHFDMRALGMVGGPANGSSLSNLIKGFYINCYFDGYFSGIDSHTTGTGGYRAWFWNSISNELGNFWNCWFNFRARGPVNTGIEGQCISNNNLTFCSPSMKFRNCVFTAQLDDGATFYLGLNNNRDAAGALQSGTARSLLNNAYGCTHGKTDTYRGYDQDPYLVEIPTALAVARPENGSPLLSTNQQRLPGGYDLEYDKDWITRNAANTPRGPWEILDTTW